jgi:hypothetical protein
MATAPEYQTHEYIDEDGLAERYFIPPRTAQRWRATGGGPPFVRLGQRRVLYRIADVEAWLRERTYRHRASSAGSLPIRPICTRSPIGTLARHGAAC